MFSQNTSVTSLYFSPSIRCCLFHSWTVTFLTQQMCRTARTFASVLPATKTCTTRQAWYDIYIIMAESNLLIPREPHARTDCTLEMLSLLLCDWIAPHYKSYNLSADDRTHYNIMWRLLYLSKTPLGKSSFKVKQTSSFYCTPHEKTSICNTDAYVPYKESLILSSASMQLSWVQ